MEKAIKIPTLLGLGILLTGLIGGIFLTSSRQVFFSQAKEENRPQDITITNLTPTKASISWRTDNPVTGFVEAGPSQMLGLNFADERDNINPNPYLLHFVTLQNLKPNTTYYYKIQSGATKFPPLETLTFKTPTDMPKKNYQSLVGTVVSSNLKPVPEAIISLQIPGAQPVSTITKKEGNFILPLSNLVNENLAGSFELPVSGISVKLVLYGPTGDKSQVLLKLPAQISILPPLTLGENIDLTEKLLPPVTPTPSDMISFDLNKDGVVNVLDSAIIRKNFGSKPKQKEADLNRDNKVDQEDLKIINGVISNPAHPLTLQSGQITPTPR